MAYYNITGDTQFTDQMYDDAEWYSEYQRVCLVDPTALPTSPFNTSFVVSTTEGLAVTSSTPAITKASATLTSSATSTSTATSATATPTPTVTISPNGLCGTANYGYTCEGSSFGECCSTYGYCGSTDDYCLSANCDANFGICPGSVSPNGLCGSANYDYTCQGSTFGDCCNGSSDDYCTSANCDAAYGTIRS
ncbi:hypothetical protein N7471_012271 [Penicillium samsonianum]|uniref:uncharacterized protein n=1 Tax=Penicillium samsonianum TaxID=1882272 RepID=UPI002546C0E2|nr:uncharacterized protein N7471_012271 [Penicillium samsonianum]KAJ6124954.1 hypothetical protein N7471_012271 [Penicillium samsonianum]